MGGLVAAVLVVMLAAGPSLDALICRDEPAESVASAGQLLSRTAVTDDHSAPSTKHEGGVCVHGHCHHGVAFASEGAGAPSGPAPMSDRHALLTYPQLTSTTPTGLERPPRA